MKAVLLPKRKEGPWGVLEDSCGPRHEGVLLLSHGSRRCICRHPTSTGMTSSRNCICHWCF